MHCLLCLFFYLFYFIKVPLFVMISLTWLYLTVSLIWVCFVILDLMEILVTVCLGILILCSVVITLVLFFAPHSIFLFMATHLVLVFSMQVYEKVHISLILNHLFYQRSLKFKEILYYHHKF